MIIDSSTLSRSLIKWYLSAAMVLLSIFYMLDEGVQEQNPDKTSEMKELVLGIYHTATYMMYNNKKLPEQGC